MLDDFFVRAVLAGSMLALVAGPLGCFVVWRRMAYFGDTIAHAALLGVALALLFNLNITAGVFAVAVLVSLLLIVVQRRAGLSSDALLGILSHSTLAVGLVIVSFLTWVRVDLVGFLFGDILAVSKEDLLIIAIGGALILAVLGWFWRPMLAATLSVELAEAEGQRPELMRVILMVLLALVIAIAMKLVGILLITSLLVIPAASARRLSASPEQMALIAALFGVVAVWGGMAMSLNFDTPSGPSIVVGALILFLITLIVPANLFGRDVADGGLPHD
ncbi:MAG: metal ABC transporter permease [Hyphomicrobiaceae bacterium]|nr:metal ABC transporter permease [Hyphomicrobiaceae bacterium]MCC0022735.1 metal ABC transporter permease [Hyphomicrobiaceae bacterium]